MVDSPRNVLYLFPAAEGRYGKLEELIAALELQLALLERTPRGMLSPEEEEALDQHIADVRRRKIECTQEIVSIEDGLS